MPSILLRSLLLPAAFMAASTHAQAQRITDPNSNLWISHWGDHRLSAHWSVHTEAHWRRANMGVNWQQWLIRPAVNYHLNDQVMFTLGYSFVMTYPYGEHPIRFTTWEHQTYQQAQINQALGRLRFNHRARLEQRYMARIVAAADDPTEGELDTYTYQSRFRYRVWLTLPLGKHTKAEPGVFTANLYDELFINFGDSQRLDFMNQNRTSALLGYQVSKPLNVMLGYMLQNLQRPGAANGADLVEVNSTVHVVLVYNLDLRKKQAATTP